MILLNFLTEDEKLILLCKYYWELKVNHDFAHSIKDIAQAFSFKSSEVPKIAQQYCAAYAETIRCPNCEANYQYKTRDDFKQLLRSRTTTQICDDCFQKEKSLRQAQEQLKLEQKSALVRSHFSLDKRTFIDMRTISFEDAVYFLSLVRLGANEDLSFIKPFRLKTELFSPSKALDFQVLQQLYRHGIIYPHPDSSLDSFEIGEDDSMHFFLEEVKWALSREPNFDDSKKIVQELEQVFRNKCWPQHWQNDALGLWKKIALQESFQYLEVVLNEHDFRFSPGEKTNLVFSNLLEQYSVAQMYNFIWRAAKDAASFYLRKPVNKQHAANTIVSSIQRQAERARSENWQVKPYRRDFRCPQSIVSQVLFNTALQIGEEGFTLPPIIIDLVKSDVGDLGEDQ
jgi:hypothetical protein